MNTEPASRATDRHPNRPTSTTGTTGTNRPGKLTIVVILFNMNEEARQTLYSLSTHYQRNVSEEAYEVVVVDNGSASPIGQTEATRWGGNFRYYEYSDPSPSPAAALNFAVRKSDSDALGFIVDGARIASPGLVFWALKALTSFVNPVCTAPAFHLGPDIHRVAVANGHSKQAERELLRSIDWTRNGYDLFGISTIAPSSRQAWLGAGSESSSLFLRRALYEAVGGYDERFDGPGGGFLNHDLYGRLLERDDVELVSLLGEGTFHQMHGGAATGQSRERLDELTATWRAQYEQLRGHPLTPPGRRPVCLGTVHDAARPVLMRAMQQD